MGSDIDTDIERGLTHDEVGERLSRYGYNEVPEKRPNKLIIFLKKFWGITPLMLEITMVLTYVIGKYYDTVMVAFLLVFNSALGFYQTEKANTALEYLRKKLSVDARVRRDRKWELLPSRELVPGDVVRLRTGDLVPADVKAVSGVAEVDQSALTGESLNIEKNVGDVIYSGSIVRRGEVTGVVVSTGLRTYFGKTVELVSIAKPKMHMEAVTTDVVKWMLAMVFVLLVIAMGFALWKGMDILSLIPITVLLLISTIPVALPTMFIVSTALGSLELAKMGVLVTRLNAVEDAATMDILCVDKTGTVTMNRLSVAGTLAAGKYREADVLLYGTLASEEANRDPIDMAVIDAAAHEGISIADYTVSKFVPFDPSVRRTEAVVEYQGSQFLVMKGAVGTIAPMCKNAPQEIEQIQSDVENAISEKGYRAIAIAKGMDRDSIGLVGVVFLYDMPRPDSPGLIKELKELGIGVKMLTGDALPIARESAMQVGLGDKVADVQKLKQIKDGRQKIAEIEKNDVFAEVHPEGKYVIVKNLQEGRHIVGMTGDGVNDAPALKQAEVSIAVSSATDVAKKAAGVVLTREGLGGIVDLVKSGRRIYRRIITWIFNKIVRTFQVMVFLIIAFILTGQYVISIFSMILMMFLADFVILSLATDNVAYSRKPDNWDLTGLIKVAVPLGLVIVAESLVLLYAGYAWFGLGDGSDRIYTYTFVMFMFLSFSDVMIAREKRHFWQSVPGRALSIAIFADVMLVILISIVGLPGLAPLSPATVLFVLVSVLVVTFGLNDLIKVFLVRMFWRDD
jgi:H+-transporting ATPase